MKIASLLLALALSTGPAWVSGARAAGAEDVEWLGWNKAMAEAASKDRPILVDVYTNWCGWCKRMDRDVYARADVRQYLSRHFVAVRLNAESLDEVRFEDRAYTLRGLAQRFHVSGYPTTIFLKSNGEHLASVPGYVPADRFKLLLRYIGEDHIGRGVQWPDFERTAAPAR
jgi:thioredoxin-related protein